MSIGSLFAGIGGFDLAARWLGWQTKWFSEIDPYASAVLKKHWPTVPNHGDITQIKGSEVEKVDILCGGFPCQDISLAGKGAGIEGSRSGLWTHYAQLIEEIQPKYVVAENVSALRSRGLDKVLREISALGYDAEWHCIPAAYVGAPHRRDRIWIVAYANGNDGRAWRSRRLTASSAGECKPKQALQAVADASSYRQLRSSQQDEFSIEREQEQASCRDYPDRCVGNRGRLDVGGNVFGRKSGDWWLTEPDVGRVANGIPRRVDRLRCLGNAIVPQVAHTLFRAIEHRENNIEVA